MTTYPWPSDLGPMPVMKDGKLSYVEPPRQRWCDDDKILDYYLDRGMYEYAGRMMAARRR